MPTTSGVAILGLGPALAEGVLSRWRDGEKGIHQPRRLQIYPTSEEGRSYGRLGAPAAGHDLTWLVATRGQLTPRAVAYALRDVWSRPGLDNRTRQLAAVAAFAAIGETGFMQIHAGYALNAGAKEEELKEVIYMVTVPAGFPKAISASQALSDLFAARAAGEDAP